MTLLYLEFENPNPKPCTLDLDPIRFLKHIAARTAPRKIPPYRVFTESSCRTAYYLERILSNP